MNFGEAIDLLKQGKRVARAGWNGKNMFLFINFGSTDYSKPMAPDIGGVPSVLFEAADRGTGTRMPNINMKAADGSIVTGWLASQTDILAEDWKELVTLDLSFDVLLDPNEGPQEIQVNLVVTPEEEDEVLNTAGPAPADEGEPYLTFAPFGTILTKCDNPFCPCQLLQAEGNA